MKLIVIAAAALLVAGCTGIQPPLVDMRGKDQTQFNRDWIACKESAPFISTSMALDECMARKGYTIMWGSQS